MVRVGRLHSETTVAAEQLSRLFVLVGHVAIKQIAHLETVERHWKRRRHEESVAEKAAAEKAATDKAAADAAWARKKTAAGRKSEAPALARGTTGDDLEAAAATGSAEDEFTDSVQMVREQELLNSSKALLAVYGPMAAMVAASAKSYEVRARGGHPKREAGYATLLTRLVAFLRPVVTQDTMLQVAAVTCLCKLMCVSSEFCEDNLQLLFTLLEKSPLEVVRANIAIAIGDMAICFNRYGTLSRSQSRKVQGGVVPIEERSRSQSRKVKGRVGPTR